MSQNAQVTRYGSRTAKVHPSRGAIAQADVSITITNGVARVALRVDADHESSASLSLRIFDVELLAAALQDAVKAMNRVGPARPLPMRTSTR